MKVIKRETHKIDAEGQVLGKLASEIALLLRGKNKPGYVPYEDSGDFVTIKNAGKIKFTGKKLDTKKYFRFTGYLGNLKTTTLREFYKKSPTEVLRTAVMGMLCKNKLRARQIKRLKFEK